MLDKIVEGRMAQVLRRSLPARAAVRQGQHPHRRAADRRPRSPSWARTSASRASSASRSATPQRPAEEQAERRQPAAVTDGRLQAHPAETQRRGVGRPARLRHRCRPGHSPGRGGRRRGRAPAFRSVWWWAAATSSAALPPPPRTWTASPATTWACWPRSSTALALAGRPGADGHSHPRDERDRDAPGGRALHPPARHPAPGKRPHRDLRGRHLESRTSPPIPRPRCALSRSRPK